MLPINNATVHLRGPTLDSIACAMSPHPPVVFALLALSAACRESPPEAEQDKTSTDASVEVAADPSAEVICNRPPSPQCIDDHTPRTPAGGSSCVDGARQYATEESRCAHGCSDGVCNDCQPSDWERTYHPPFANAAIDSSLTIAFDGLGGIHLAAHMNDRGGFAYGHRAPDGTWSGERVGTKADFGLIPSIAADARGGVYVTVSDRRDKALQHFRRLPGGIWKGEIVATDMIFDMTDTTVTPSGEVHVAFVGDEASHLKYAHRCDSGPFIVETVDADD